jgi:hypothetical protein
VKVYRVELMILDFDGVGEGIPDVIENARYPNRCISPGVVSMASVDIGEWDDSHPLNNDATRGAEFRRLFPSASLAPGDTPAGTLAERIANILNVPDEEGYNQKWSWREKLVSIRRLVEEQVAMDSVPAPSDRAETQTERTPK